jgi:hypothetical protein
MRLRYKARTKLANITPDPFPVRHFQDAGSEFVSLVNNVPFYAAMERGGRAEGVVAQACKKHGVSLTELRSGSRRAELPGVRAELAQRLVEDFGLTMAEAARQLGISTSGISKTLARSLSR